MLDARFIRVDSFNELLSLAGNMQLAQDANTQSKDNAGGTTPALSFARPGSADRPIPPPWPHPPHPFPPTLPGSWPFPPPPTPFPPPLPPLRSLRGGCWLINYEPVPNSSVKYDGTIRVEHNSSGTTASGDLYQRPVLTQPSLPPNPPTVITLPPPSPRGGFPSFALGAYRYFTRVVDIPEKYYIGDTFRIGFELWRFFAGSNTWSNGPESTLKASMHLMTAPADYPGEYFEGDVKDAAGAVTGRLKMGWVSEYYRKIIIEIDTLPFSVRPEDNGIEGGEDWYTVFNKVGFEVDVLPPDTDTPSTIADFLSGKWTNAEMHAAMLQRRKPIYLDFSQWHYHILAVPLIERTERGIMYDYGSTDSDKLPREGVGIACDWVPQATDRVPWGETVGKRWGDNAAAYFRTAVHELGHALGLEHNSTDTDFMCTSDTIAKAPGGPFPRQIKWAFADDDLKRLRHWPDIFIRPGGVPFLGAMNSGLPMTPTDFDIRHPDLKLELKPVEGHSDFPIGAPVRVNLTLTNMGKSPLMVPSDINLRSPFFSGTVTANFITAPGIIVPLVYCTDSNPISELKAGESRSGSITLLRGRSGSLFPTSALYTITVNVAWPIDINFTSYVFGKCNVFIRPPTNSKLAFRLLADSDLHLLMMTGGDDPRFERSQEIIHAAMKDDTMKQHFAFAEAKRLAKKFGKREGDAAAAGRVLAGMNAVLTRDENAVLKDLGVDV